MKYLTLITLVFFIACAPEPASDTNEDIDEEKIEIKEEELPPSVLQNFNVTKASNFKVIDIHENVNGQKLHYKISFLADTLRPKQAGIYSLPRINFRNMQVEKQSNNLNNLPKDFYNKFETAVKCQREHSYPKWEEVLQRADFNFDGHEDLYFVNEYCFAQNTGYHIYLYDPKAKRYYREIQLEEEAWARIEFHEEEKSFTLYGPISAREGLQRTYKYRKNNELLRIKEVRTE